MKNGNSFEEIEEMESLKKKELRSMFQCAVLESKKENKFTLGECLLENKKTIAYRRDRIP